MANKVVTDNGKMWIADICMNSGHPQLNGHVNLHLYTNNYTPTSSDIITDYTEATYVGYAAALLSGASDGGIDGSDRDTWTWPSELFQATSSSGLPETVYGAYYTDTGDTTVLWAEKFAGTFAFNASGDGFTFVPTFSFASIF